MAGPFGAFMFVLGPVLAALAPAAGLGRELGRGFGVAALGLLGGFLLWGTLVEPLEERSVSGSILLMLLGVGVIGSVALLAGGSNVAQGFSYGRSANLGR